MGLLVGGFGLLLRRLLLFELFPRDDIVAQLLVTAEFG